MKKMSIYEPALCCETGLCGVNVDPELLRITTVLNNLKNKGIIIARYNLNSTPNVTFEPGCRNNWHVHHGDKGGGQILRVPQVVVTIRNGARRHRNFIRVRILQMSGWSLFRMRTITN